MSMSKQSLFRTYHTGLAFLGMGLMRYEPLLVQGFKPRSQQVPGKGWFPRKHLLHWTDYRYRVQKLMRE